MIGSLILSYSMVLLTIKERDYCGHFWIVPTTGSTIQIYNSLQIWSSCLNFHICLFPLQFNIIYIYIYKLHGKLQMQELTIVCHSIIFFFLGKPTETTESIVNNFFKKWILLIITVPKYRLSILTRYLPFHFYFLKLNSAHKAYYTYTIVFTISPLTFPSIADEC